MRAPKEELRESFPFTRRTAVSAGGRCFIRGVFMFGWLPIATAQALGDPMAPPAPRAAEVSHDATAPGPAMRFTGLQGVIIGPQRRLALIDGSVVPAGGKVGNREVSNVQADSVTLREGSERVTVPMFPQIEKKRRP